MERLYIIKAENAGNLNVCLTFSDDNETKSANSAFVTSAKPTWAVNWSSDATIPNWQNPDAAKYE